jgi:hypothetical protein
MNVRIEHPGTHETYIPKASSIFSTQRELPWKALEEGLNVGMAGPCTLLPYRPKCGVLFGTDSTVTIVLGMRDSGWAEASHLFRESTGRSARRSIQQDPPILHGHTSCRATHAQAVTPNS